MVLFGTQPFTSKLVMSNLEWFRHEWIWDKIRCTGGANSSYSPMKAHEHILIFAKKASLYNPQMESWNGKTLTRRKTVTTYRDNSHSFASHRNAGKDEKLKRGRFPDTVLRIAALGSNDPERNIHPTQKPVALLQYLIRTYTNPGDLILDNCMGSGTTLLAAQNEGRRAVGIELSEEYCKIAIDRLRQPSFFSIPNKPKTKRPKQLELKTFHRSGQ